MKATISVESLVGTLLPNGSRGKPGDISDYPFWPPDIFAVCAFLLQQTDSYTYLQDHRAGSLGSIISDADTKEGLIAIGKSWSNLPYLSGEAEPIVAKLWLDLVSTTDCISGVGSSTRWIINASKLLIIADEACKGIGFYEWQDDTAARSKNQGWIAATYSQLHMGKLTTKEVAEALRKEPRVQTRIFTLMKAVNAAKNKKSQRAALVTACIMVPEQLVCVHPKARTPSVGCTLRSLTHNLSLHPGSGTLRSGWILPNIAHKDRRQGFNILLVPYPYEIEPSSFQFSHRGTNSYGQFHIDQRWLPMRVLGKESVVELVEHLYAAAQRETGSIDAIVLPEAALDVDIYDKLVQMLKEKFKADQLLLISGVSSPSPSLRNAVKCTLIGNVVDVSFVQRKHHRWSLDSKQIKTYRLGRVSKDTKRWWEDIQVSERELNYFVFRSGSCLTTLICEDLARTDPCQASIRSVGPNILIALLMDGPQISGRWSERYAMGLADDPGTSVLSLTSMGLIRRSNKVCKTTSTAIALWRDSKTGTKELSLGFEDKALVLGLKSRRVDEETLDGRLDQENSHIWEFVKCTGVS